MYTYTVYCHKCGLLVWSAKSAKGWPTPDEAVRAARDAAQAQRYGLAPAEYEEHENGAYLRSCENGERIFKNYTI